MTEKRLQAAANQAVIYRNYRRARDRALAKLSQMYPNVYWELLQKEKESDEQLGKKWVDISGRTNAPRSRKGKARKSRTKTRNHSGNKRKTSRHNGGKA